MAEQSWYSRWEKQSGPIDENGDIVSIVDTESNNSSAPTAYRNFFRQIKIFMERSQQRRPSGVIATPPDTADTENDIRYKEYAITLQANYEDLESAYKKQYEASSKLQEKLTEQQLINLQTHHSLNNLKLQQKTEQAARDSQTTELLGRVNDLEIRNAQLEAELTKECQRFKHLEESIEVATQRLADQLKSKDATIMAMAKQRQTLEMQMMDSHKELHNTKGELEQKKNDIATLSQLVLTTSALPPTRNLFTKYVNEILSTHALKTMLQSCSNSVPPLLQQHHQTMFQQSMNHIRQTLAQRQQQMQQQQLLQQQQQQLQKQQQLLQQQQYQQF